MREWTTTMLGSWRWSIRPDWAERLLDDQGLPLNGWRARGLLQVVKTSSQRTVYRVCLPTGGIYVKQHGVASWRACLRQWLRPSKARIEAQKALALQALGVATIEPIAIGEEAGGASCLATLDLEGGIPLNAFVEQHVARLPPQEHVHVRRKLAAALGAFLARLHRLGVAHGDPHPGNLVVRWQTNGEPILHLIDLHLVHVGAPLHWPAARANLLLFNRWFVQKTNRTDRQRFWRAYVAGRTDLPALQAEQRKLVRALETDTWRSCLEFWRKRDSRCLHNGKYFHVLRGPGWKAWGVRELPRALLERLGREPEAPLREARRILKHSRSSTVAIVDLDLGQGMVPCVYKKFAWTKWRLPGLHLVRATPIMRSWINGHRMLECGLPTPRPLAAIERRSLGMAREGYLLTPLLPGALDLHAWLQAHCGDVNAHAQRCALVEKLARLVRRLHECGLSHRDLKAANVLATEEAGALGLHFVDLVGVERRSQVKARYRVRDLARLNAGADRHPEVSRTDRLRFLRVYLQWGLRGDRSWKSWWRAVAQATEHKVARNRQRGRPIS